MRIAVSGTHRTGKTTLVEALAERLEGYTVVDEPYGALEEEGIEFSDPPTVEDFARQLTRSIDQIAHSGPHTLFDRCPLDFVAYLQALDEEVDLVPVRAALEALDLIVLVPIEARVPVGAHEDRRLRERVDALVPGVETFGTPTIEVSGSIEDRVQHVLRVIRQGA